MGMLIQPIFQLIKGFLKFLWWIGFYWLFIIMTPVTLYEIIGKSYATKHGTFFGQAPNLMGNVLAPVWLENICFYVSLIFMALTVIQNLYRLVKQEPKFNIFKAMFGMLKRKKEVGIVAEVNLDRVEDISGFVFGKLNGKYVTKKEEEDGHMLIIGGTGSGKTSCVAIPTLMSWNRRVFAIDVKGELYQKTSKARDTNFIKVFNPTDRNANGYNPFYMLSHTDDLSSEAKALAISICPLPGDVKDPFWIKSAQNMLTGFILYFYGFQLSFSATMIQIKSKPVKDIISEIMLSNNQKAKIEVSQFVGMDDKTVSGVFTELSNHITIFATSEDLIQALDGHGECITPQDLENGYDIFCCIPDYKIDQWKELLGMMCNQFLNAFKRRSIGNTNPILFLIDEFANIGRIDSITNALAILRDKKIQIALFIQSKSQLNLTYGKDTAEIIADNCSYKAILKASEPTTQKWCCELIGTYDQEKFSTNVNSDMIGIGKGTGQSKTTEERKIIKPEEFGSLGKDIICVFPTGWRRIQKTPYHLDNNFKNQ